MKNTKYKLKNQLKLKSSFTGSNITKYSGLYTGLIPDLKTQYLQKPDITR